MPTERVSAFLTDVVTKIWGLNAVTTPRLVWLLNNTFRALSLLGLTLLELPRFLLDAPYRTSLLATLANDQVRAYFTYEFPQSPGAIHQWVTPVLNKIGSLIFDPDARLMVAGNRTINFRDVIDKRHVVLVNISKGILGEGASALLGAFIVALFQKAALSRANTTHRAPYYLYLDEFQNYTTDNIQDILSESRKYALSLTLAHQYMDQLAPDLRNAVLNTTGTLCSFRVSFHDAFPLAKELFPSSDFLATHKQVLKLRRFRGFLVPLLMGRDEELGWDGLAHELSGLAPRQLWVRRRGPGVPVKLQTLAIPDPTVTPELRAIVALLYETSGSIYGRRKQTARQEAQQSQAGWTIPLVNYTRSSKSREDASDASVWGQ
jgi:hypothetical protein